MDKDQLRELLTTHGLDEAQSGAIVAELGELEELNTIKKSLEGSVSCETLESKISEAFKTGFECGDDYASSQIAAGLDQLTKAISDRDEQHARIQKGFLVLMERNAERRAPAEEPKEEALFKGVVSPEPADPKHAERAAQSGDESLLPAYELGLVSGDDMESILKKLGV